MIRNIIFDIGNVLTDYRWEGFLADKGFDAEMIQKIAKASVMHPAWAEYDRGTWTDEQVLAAFVKDAPQLELFFAAVSVYFSHFRFSTFLVTHRIYDGMLFNKL